MPPKTGEFHRRSDYQPTQHQSVVEFRKNLADALNKAPYSVGSTLVKDHDNPAAMIVPVKGGELITRAYELGTIEESVFKESLLDVVSKLQFSGSNKQASVVMLINQVLKSVDTRLENAEG